MGTSKETISEWFDRGIEEYDATHLIVVCDSFSYEDYPSFVLKDEDVKEKVAEYQKASMQRVMEVYNLSKNKEKQLNKSRCWDLSGYSLKSKNSNNSDLDFVEL